MPSLENFNNLFTNILSDPYKFKTLFFSIIVIIIIMIIAEFSNNSLQLVKIFKNYITKFIIIILLFLVAFKCDVKSIIIIYFVTFVFLWIINGINISEEFYNMQNKKNIGNINGIYDNLNYDNMKTVPNFTLKKDNSNSCQNSENENIIECIHQPNNPNNPCNECTANTKISNELKISENINNNEMVNLDEKSLLGFNEMNQTQEITENNKKQKKMFSKKFENIFDARDFIENNNKDDRIKYIQHQTLNRSCDVNCYNPMANTGKPNFNGEIDSI